MGGIQAERPYGSMEKKGALRTIECLERVGKGFVKMVPHHAHFLDRGPGWSSSVDFPSRELSHKAENVFPN